MAHLIVRLELEQLFELGSVDCLGLACLLLRRREGDWVVGGVMAARDSGADGKTINRIPRLVAMG